MGLVVAGGGSVAFVDHRHVRVDLVREKLSLRRQAWIEFPSCTLLMIPYHRLVIHFAGDWIIKTGPVFALLAGIVV